MFIFLLIGACERSPQVNVAGDWGPRPTLATRDRARSLHWLDSGRFTTVTSEDVWVLWDLVHGQVRRVEYTADALPTPDGAWLVGGRIARRTHARTGPLSMRFDTTVEVRGTRTADLGKMVVEWSAEHARMRRIVGWKRPVKTRTGECVQVGDRRACIGTKVVTLHDGETRVGVWGRRSPGRLGTPVRELMFSTDGDVFVWFEDDGSGLIYGWHRSTGYWSVERLGNVTALSPDGEVFFVAGGEGVALFDTRSGQRLD